MTAGRVSLGKDTGNMRVAHAVRSLANRVSPSPPPHVSPRPLRLSKSSLRYAFPAASALRGEHSYSNPPSTEHSPLILSFAIAGMSLLVSSSAARVSCQPDSLPPDAKSTSKSGHSSTLRQFLDNRPQLPRSDVSPSRNLSHAVMASGLIPRDSQCLPASPYPTQSNRKRKLSYLTTMDNLCNVIESQKHWTSGPIHFTSASSKSNDAPMTVDLAKTMEKGKNKPRKGKRNDTTCYWLMSCLNKNDRETVSEVKSIFINACKSAGFKVGGEYEPRHESIVFECNRSKFINRDKSLQQSRISYEKRIATLGVSEQEKPFIRRGKRSSKPIEGRDGFDTKCKFRFSVYWDQDSMRWYVPKEQQGCLQHAGHMREDPLNIRLNSKFLGTKEQRQNIVDAVDSEVRPASAARIFETQSGEHLDWHQVNYLKRVKGKNASLPNETPADKLIRELSSDASKSFILLFADIDVGSSLITIKTKKRKTNNALPIDEIVGDTLGNEIDNPKIFAQTLRGRRDKMRHTTSNQLLLAAAWTSDPARRLLDMFPEFMGGDDTEKTNSEDRPLYTILGQDSNNRSFPHTWCFMPSKAQWAYQWIWGTAVPALHPGSVLSRVMLINCDADPQETRAIESVVGRGKDISAVFPNAWQRWCAWHRIDRNFLRDPAYVSILATTRKSGSTRAAEIDVFTRYLWYRVKCYETQEELDFADKLMNFYLQEEDQSDHVGVLDKACRDALKQYKTKTFEPSAKKLFEANFDCRTFGKCTTGINEAEHRVIKYSDLGPRPCDDIGSTHRKLYDLHKTRTVANSKKAAHLANTQLTNDAEHFFSAEDITPYCNERLRKNLNDSSNYHAYRVDDSTFFVKRDYVKCDTCPQDDLDLPAEICDGVFKELETEVDNMTPRSNQQKESKKVIEKMFGDGKGALPAYKELLSGATKYHIIPRFERTRTVRIVENNGEFYLQCDCPCWKKYGHACPHMYRIIGCRGLSKMDADIRWNSKYINYFGKNDELTSKLIDARNSQPPGIPLNRDFVTQLQEDDMDNGLATNGKGDVPVEYFLSSLGKIRLRGPNNYWHHNAEKFSEEETLAFQLPGNELYVPSFDGSPRSTSDAKHAIAAKPAAASLQVARLSTLVVPGQNEEEDLDFDNGGGFDNDEDWTGNLKHNSYNDGMYKYQEVAKVCDNKEKNTKIMLHYLELAKRHILAGHGLDSDLASSGNGTTNLTRPISDSRGMSSFPKVHSSKTIAARMKKITSPCNNGVGKKRKRK